jgi:hypothetical protein
MSETMIWSLAGLTLGAAASAVALRARRDSVHREMDRTAAAGLLGWEYQRLDAGFSIVGRHLGRCWEVVVSHDESARWTTFTFGAPDMDMAQVRVVRKGLPVIANRRVNSAQPAMQPLTQQLIAGPDFQRRYDVLAAQAFDAQRIVTPELQDLILAWPGQNQMLTHWWMQHFNNFQMWVCPHGVRLSVERSLSNWPEIQHLVLLGQTVALRNGLL